MATPWKHPKSGIYYLRIAVPDALRISLNKTEIKKSLRTKNFSDAKARFAVEYADTQEMFMRCKQGASLTQKDIQVLSQRWLVGALEEMDLADSFDEYVLNTHIDGEVFSEAFTEHIESALESSYQDQYGLVGSEVDQLLSDHGVFILIGSTQYRQLVNRVCWNLMELHTIGLQRYIGDWTPIAPSKVVLATHDLSRESSPVIPVYHSTGFKPLGSMVADFIDYKLSRGDWVGKTEGDAREVFGLFVDINGVRRDPDAITREDFRSFVSLLTRIPLRYNMKAEYKGLPLVDVIKLGEKLGADTLSLGTVKKKFVFILSLFKFAAHEEWVDKNRAEGITVKVDGSGSKRKVFSADELTRIFNATEGVARSSDYWLPRIALTTGMRSNEILQLAVGDVRQSEGGVWYFDINRAVDSETGKSKRLKTKNSERKVPVPEALIGIGLLDYVSSVGVGRLFKCVQLGGDGTYSFIYSKRFNKVLGGLGIKPVASSKELKDFHSFRHTFRSNAREYGVHREEVELIGGWSSGEVSAGDGYGREFNVFIGRLKGSIDLIQYDGVVF